MEMINRSFERRVADMNNGSTPRPLKRKLQSTFSTPTPNGRRGPGNELLEASDKRMRSILNSARTELFPTTAKPVIQQVNPGYQNTFDYRSPVTKFPQFPPRPLSSAVRPPKKAELKEVMTPLVLGRPKKLHGESQAASRGPGSVLLPTSLLYEWDSDTFHHAEERDNVALRRENQDLRRYNLAARVDLERARAKELKQTMELETFKHLVSIQSKLRDAGLAPGLHGVLGQTGSFTVSTTKHSSTELVVSAVGMSRGGALSEEEDAASGSGGRESNQEPAWKALYNKIREPSKIEKATSLEKEIEYTESKLRALQLGRPAKLKAEKKPEDKTLVDAFTSLSDEAELAVDEALGGGDRYEVLVTHDKSNIDVTRAVIQCLSPGVWLNDEVINVYMDLLKEREAREPDRFLKCHFFNTFFYNKLYKDKRSYDYKAIRRWTTQKKLGYSLSDCDKILVPIHQDIHWCLAVINIRDKQLEYLDSLKGGDRSVLDVLARYIGDEAKDKDGKVLDASTWGQDYPKDIPEQLNGCDCGVFMVKYADFHSRGAPLQFTQDDMEYFRRKMVWEILDLKAT